jgi:hypothetical protein
MLKAKRADHSAQVSPQTWILALTVLAVDIRANALVITPNYDASVASLSDASQVENAVAYAIQQIESVISDPITLNIDIDANTSGLGESSTAVLTGFSYTDVRDALIATSSSASDATAVASLPATNPTNGSLEMATAKPGRSDSSAALQPTAHLPSTPLSPTHSTRIIGPSAGNSTSSALPSTS